jgi:hypothetical protein
MAVGYKIYLHTNTDQPERHKYKMISIRKNIFMTKKSITYKVEHRLDSNKNKNKILTNIYIKRNNRLIIY